MTFRLCGQEFAVSAPRVKGIVPMHDMEPVEDGPPWLMGRATIQGQRFDVLDLGGWLGLSRKVRGRNPCIVVVEGASILGFPVDGVSGVLKARLSDYRNGKLRIGRPRRVLDADGLFVG